MRGGFLIVTVILIVRKNEKKQDSTGKSKRVKESVRYQRALKKGKVGRPTLPDVVKQRIAALLKQGRSYSYICKRVMYRGRYNRGGF